jgi:phosphoribosylaminoimidazolecarboxamide formyltransferase/IMP cyclohydrolase
LRRCLAADPVSVFGGIVSLSGKVGAEEARMLTSLFLEVVIAPDYSEEALSVLSQKKNLRVVKWPGMLTSAPAVEIRAIRGGYLTQDPMVVNEDTAQWDVHGEPLSAQEVEDALLALKVVAELKSNAIAIVADGQSLGLGMGQVNRVDSVEHALQRAQKFHPNTKHWTLASDAFFPFPDSVELMSKFPVRTVVQPGGSVKDKDVLEAAKKYGIRMILTGKRYFRH